ncbi:MAG: SpoIIE family protein phosphatase [Acidobacteria bacterium]|nr:SpoIIE family protein phosphatase [Thermoanaerobaculia bacterium]NLN10643.1 SpoIIE family protein phosphatase [Acidobacteriota bacterium]MBP7812607.1 SpoIIE family protein phosphatase [Thermoanaerobaculia bacterium]MBP8844801.1 SpoIIE family protein phosphatase [Thermoanaerobaculia bacterium]HPA95096.1 SpoIIE family protein phosphatase [Thermoanaerobaculia bacterium]
MWPAEPLLVARNALGGPARVPVSGTLRVGRDQANDLALAEATVSRRHARIVWRDGRLEVEDLGSSGGTFVNGLPIRRQELRPGDRLRFGPRVEYEVVTEELRATSALDLSQLIPREEKGELRQLQTLLDVARALNAATVLDEVLQVVLQAAVRLSGATRGLLVLRDAEGNREAAQAFPPGETLALEATAGALFERVLDARHSETLKIEGRELIATPLLVARRPLGSGQDASFIGRVEILGGLLLERPLRGRGIPRETLAVVESLAADAATAIDSARLYREARDKAKIEHEMSMARTIQAALLPLPPEVPFAEIHAQSEPARVVGGDLFHLHQRPDGELSLAVGDVSGKGVSAALLMAVAQGMLGLLDELPQPLAELLAALDRGLRAKNPGNRFLTLAAVRLAPDGTLRIANAGHCAVRILRAGGGVETVPATGPLLGLLPAASWRIEERRLAAGDSLVLYSDGIPESSDAGDRELGEEGVEAALASLTSESPEAVGTALLATAARHREGREAEDDVTLVVARYRGAGA